MPYVCSVPKQLSLNARVLLLKKKKEEIKERVLLLGSKQAANLNRKKKFRYIKDGLFVTKAEENRQAHSRCAPPQKALICKTFMICPGLSQMLPSLLSLKAHNGLPAKMEPCVTQIAITGGGFVW